MQVGVIHPGAMGAVIAGAARAPVRWASENRSPETRFRAAENDLIDIHRMADLVDQSDVLVSVCPSHAAVEVASTVEKFGYDGIYVDANAVAPETARQIASLFDRFVDGGIVGPPPLQPGTTRLYLAGPCAEEIASLWKATNLDTRVLGGPIGSASALKAAYAGWTKGTAALLLAVVAYATANGVKDDLVAEWETSIPGLATRSDATAARIESKAWRFEGEMAEIKAAMDSVGLPNGFHDAAREIYERLAHLRGSEGLTADEVSAALLRK